MGVLSILPEEFVVADPSIGREDPPKDFTAVALLTESNEAKGGATEGCGSRTKGSGGVAQGRLRVSVGGRDIALFALMGGKVHAIDAVCPHQVRSAAAAPYQDETCPPPLTVTHTGRKTRAWRRGGLRQWTEGMLSTTWMGV